ncbi:Putative succinate-semialdehyde dehydrogenase [NADP(+)] 2 [Roseimaritima multifibrata]|uniref:Succinate-semialdehyde dehydrogenase [NADP(+)] 2 n=1 Tax=Roseimaritima multifibrata TaxID=1930274 RepID=A0A517MDX0_9BACT|nr:aldehyde dehydrogenase family protein [Roseimaritima multifibrata]QDS92977.1 Putative succinate-semialdehyde dehydrogenase [NADP(+)] 2 [Roseimaritima multifibrata]
MLHLPALRWGKPYESLDKQNVVHFATGEPIAEVSQIGGGIVQRDLRKAHKAREALLQLPISDLIERCKKAAVLFETAELPMGDGTQTVDQFVHQQSASTGLPEHMCVSNMGKNAFVLAHIDQIIDCLTRGLDLSILSRGYGEEGRGVTVSYQAQTPILGAVLPNNSPGVHTLWLPAVPLQIGLALKPGSQEPWTPYRMISAFIEAGIPREAFSLYPGGHDAGGAIMANTAKSMIFGSAQTLQQHAGNPRVQAHGPGFSKILIGDDVVDDWPQFLDLMVESVLSNSGRSCINCSGIWASRHTREIGQAIAERIGPVDVLPPADPESQLAAFTVPAMATGTWAMVQQDLKESGVTDLTAEYGEKLIEKEHCAYLRPMVVHAESPACEVASKEYMFPFVSVVECPQDQMVKKIGSTLIGTVLTRDEKLIEEASRSVEIDRLNIGPIATNRLNWLQPHEGNIIEFLFRNRAYQMADMPVAANS